MTDPKRKVKNSQKSGLPPGTMVYVGNKSEEAPRITIIDYNESEYQEEEVPSPEDCFPFKDKPTVTWINIDGLRQLDVIEKIGKNFGFHPLVLEDIVNTYQRPKMEDFGDYIFLVLKMLVYDERKKKIAVEQVSLILGEGYVISFQEKIGDIFDPIRKRLREGKGRIRKSGSDYLVYALIDALVDSYFTILENLGDRVEDLEDDLLSHPEPESLQAVHKLKKELLLLKKSVWPMREVISGLERGDSQLISDSTGIYFRDVYDHTIQVIDTVETYRDVASGMVDTYLSSLSNRMNEVMKVLTIIATIFIPLTFIAGVYGMNFQYMPELKWQWGYPAVLGLMLLVFIVMIAYFRRKKWL